LDLQIVPATALNFETPSCSIFRLDTYEAKAELFCGFDDAVSTLIGQFGRHFPCARRNAWENAPFSNSYLFPIHPFSTTTSLRSAPA